MENEAQHYLERARRTRNIADGRGQLTQVATRYLTFRERKGRVEEKKWLDDVLSQPAWVLKDMTANIRANLTRRRNDLDSDLAKHGPPTDISGETKDKIHARIKDLELEIRGVLLSREVMRRNPPGAVDAFNRGENSPAMKAKILEYKNLMRLREPDNDEQEMTSIELLRPSGISREMAASFMMGAQIPGQFAMTELAKANWPLGGPKVDTPLKQAERQEIANEMIADGVASSDDRDQLLATIKELQEKLAAKEVHRKEVKEKRKAAMARARAARKPKGEMDSLPPAA